MKADEVIEVADEEIKANSSSKSTEQTDWHRLLGALLQALLSVVGIIVQTEVPLVRKALKLDILLLRRQGRRWTEAQLERLPDGIRQRSEAHILCEFKYTESVNHDALVQALNYEMLYRIDNELKVQNLATFVVSAHTPRQKLLQQYGYTKSELSGIYHSQQEAFKRVELIVLNELSNEPHNAFFKCFAAQRKARESAFHLLDMIELSVVSESVWEIVAGLRSLLQTGRENTMSDIVVTPEYVQSLGRDIRRMVIHSLTPKERLEGLSPETVLAQFKPEERLAGLELEERLAGLELEERLAGLDLEERLVGIDLAQIEDYLRKKMQTNKEKPTPKKTKARKSSKSH